MITLQAMLKNARTKHSASFEILEQDYLLSWILFGISQTEELQGKIVFKGGTALKKIYFGDNYRFSKDLDFTSFENAPKGDLLEAAIIKACAIAERELSLRHKTSLINIICERYKEKRPHPHEQEAFDIRAQFPWHRNQGTRVMVEITRSQRIVHSPNTLSIKHGYPEPFGGSILTYTLDEIAGEKLIAMYQNAIKLHERGWTRSRARDYYDLWRLLHSFGDNLNANNILDTIRLKYDTPLPIKSIDDFFDPQILQRVQEDWEPRLGKTIHPLPAYDQVVPKLKKLLIETLDFPEKF